VTPDADALWDFALAVYGRPGVAEACIALQDEAGADVVLMLGLLWLAQAHGRAASEAEIEVLDRTLCEWRGMVVQPLRDIRRALKPRLDGLPPAAAALRERLKSAELEAERIAFALLAAAIRDLPAERVEPGGEQRRFAAQRALTGYFGRLGAMPDGALPAPVEVLLAALDSAEPPGGTP
jgi:uncharacterized protein (TIGR02444 family)